MQVVKAAWTSAKLSWTNGTEERAPYARPVRARVRGSPRHVTDRSRRPDAGKLLVLKIISVLAGTFMVLAGMLAIPGSILFATYGTDYDLVYLLACVYAILFGLGALILELKDDRKATAGAWKWVTVYLRAVMTQRGKGMAYLCVGILVSVISPKREGISIGIVNVAGFLLGATGTLHMCSPPSRASRVSAWSSPLFSASPPPRSGPPQGPDPDRRLVGRARSLKIAKEPVVAPLATSTVAVASNGEADFNQPIPEGVSATGAWNDIAPVQRA